MTSRGLRAAVRFTFALSVLVATCGHTDAALVFNRIANNTTPRPGGGSFSNFSDPVMSGSTVSFVAGTSGVYTSVGGTITTVANGLTPVPGQAGNFQSFGVDCAANGNDVAFTGYYGALDNGCYARIGGTIIKIADKSTPVPGGPGSFGNFNGQQRSDISGAVVFGAEYGTFGLNGEGWSNQGIFTNLGGPLRRVAVRGQARPDGGSFYYINQPTIDATTIAFLAYFSGNDSAIMTETGGVLSPLVNQYTPVPSHPGTFYTSINYLSAMKAGRISFTGGAGGNTYGIYRAGGPSGPVRIADLTMSAPGGGIFSNVGLSAVDADGVVAFEGTANGRQGLYLGDGASILRVIEATQTLDGKTLSSLSVGRDGIDNGVLAFRAFFTDSTQGLYTVDITSLIPEPASATLLATWITSGFAMIRRRRTRLG